MNINAKDARWPGCSAENFGRFIPCRGGGTATTYYTDSHDVDEDLMTICNYGGYWNGGWSYGSSGVGIAQRHVDNVPTSSWDYVTSRLIYLS